MPRKTPKYVKKKNFFRGTPYHVMKKLENREEEEEEVITASERKLSLNKTSESPDLQSGPTCTDSRRDLEGFYLISGKQLASALQRAHVCQGGHLIPFEDQTKREGLSCTLVLRCSICSKEEEFCTSENACEGPGKSAEINRRATLAASEVGLAREGLCDFTSILGTSPPVTAPSYERHLAALSKAAQEASEEHMKMAAECLRRRAMDKDPSIKEDDFVEVAVSYDGTWHRRGHTSNHGVGVVISIDTGEVLDTEVLSKTCKQCEYRKGWDKSSDKYKAWEASHKDVCLGIHKGSSGKMEVDAAVKIWGRSEDKYKLRYKYMLSDGDSAAYKAVKDIYGDECTVHKLDCVGHVGKRMYKALDKVRKDNKGKLEDGKGVGRAKGRLRGTADTGSIGRLCKLYRSTIRSNTINMKALDNDNDKKEAVEKMRRAILAILYHSVTLSDSDVRHQYCPEDGWCEYKKTGKEKMNENHLDPVFLELLLPTFTRLSDPDLLERCLPGITQNQNESFNALIWKRCPKHLWRGPRVVRTAVNLAILAFNCGAESSRYRIFKKLNLKMGIHTTICAQIKDKYRIKRARTRAREVSKRRRKALRALRKSRDEADEEREGGLYSMGGY
ncbi:uncharacterized protein LOC121422184 [Lytechinus variegatus]|uniref:uncharacterized protein LOC121422184 n=1 Tax=Lytechinus variegatus TaxID=7654 RepID=UPI001BB1C070|nr:uncharacterized protein LOC121422184 [Lytechinus variegatus]